VSSLNSYLSVTWFDAVIDIYRTDLKINERQGLCKFDMIFLTEGWPVNLIRLGDQ
jgi:hypothetical protein